MPLLILISLLRLQSFAWNSAAIPFHGILGPIAKPKCQDLLSADSVIADILAERAGGTGPATPAPSPASPPPPPPPTRNVTAEQLSQSLTGLFQNPNPLIESVINEKVIPVNDRSLAPTMKRFGEFFNTLQDNFYERKELVTILRRAFLAEGAVLIVGPGGTAKSKIAIQIGKHIKSAAEKTTSFFRLALTQDTTSNETQGGPIMKEMMAGRTLRNWEEGVLGSAVVFLDEFFDGRLKFLRSFLTAFNEREYAQGKLVFQGKTKVFIAATNKYINEVYQMYGNNEPQALIDRFQYVYYAPAVLQNTSSILGLAQNSPKPMPELTFEELAQMSAFAQTIPLPKLEVLRTQMIFKGVRTLLKSQEVRAATEYDKAVARNERVQPPYKTTRVFSPRSLARAFQLVKVQALMRTTGYNENLVVHAQDVVEALRGFLIMQGPSPKNLKAAIQASEMDPYEGAQLQTLEIEQNAVAQVLQELETATTKAKDQMRAALESFHKAGDETAKKSALTNLLQQTMTHFTALGEIENAEKIGATQIAALEALQILVQDSDFQALLQAKN